MHRWKCAAFGLFVLCAMVPVTAAPRTSCPGTLKTIRISAAEFFGKTDTRTEVVMFGGTPQRNMVNTVDKNVPTDWCVEKGKHKNVKWIANLGSPTYGGPVIADGKVFVGTSNANPRDKSIKGRDKAVLMAFRESDGAFLWQIVHDIPADIGGEGRVQGLCSTPVYEDKRLYYVTPGCEIICAGVDGKVKWSYDMMKELKVVPWHVGNCSPLIVGDLLMICTSNGSDEEGKVASPKAPSFIAINKNTGKKPVWQSNLPGDKIIEGQFSNPTLATVNGKQQVIFAGGDCVLYSFEPATGDLIWKCNCNPIPKKKDDRAVPYIIATPVVAGTRLYVGLGVSPGGCNNLPYSHFLCVDITKKGDVSPKSFDVKDAANKDSALVWAFGGEILPPPKGRGRRAYFGQTISTAAVHDGLVYITEEIGYLHCIDAKTGQRYWEHDFRENVWGSPYWVDGKVYVGTQGGDVVIFAHGKERKVLATVSVDDAVESTPVVAGGVLYVATKTKLIAIANGN